MIECPVGKVDKRKEIKDKGRLLAIGRSWHKDLIKDEPRENDMDEIRLNKKEESNGTIK